MCKYCEEGKSMCNSNTKDLGIELHSGTAKLVAYGLDEFGWNISVSCNINYCPMCRKEAGRMIVPIVDMKEFEKIGFKKCKKPYDMCYYLCFARGSQYIFLSPVMIDIVRWEDSDPRIHKNANCRYRDRRTALEFMCELVKKGYVNLDYLERKNGN